MVKSYLKAYENHMFCDASGSSGFQQTCESDWRRARERQTHTADASEQLKNSDLSNLSKTSMLQALEGGKPADNMGICNILQLLHFLWSVFWCRPR